MEKWASSQYYSAKTGFPFSSMRAKKLLHSKGNKNVLNFVVFLASGGREVWFLRTCRTADLSELSYPDVVVYVEVLSKLTGLGSLGDLRVILEFG